MLTVQDGVAQIQTQDLIEFPAEQNHRARLNSSR
jgi:hypothetical protein